jgi:branched-chain amino acid transport system substrate-binding protein
MKCIKSLLLGAAFVSAAMGVASSVQAQEQFIALPSYRVGPYAAGGSGFYGGAIDYFNLVNLNGGVNGVKIVWEECETEYNPSRGIECYERLKTKNGGATMVEPLSTGVAYGILDRVRQDKIPMTTLGYGRSDAANGKVFPYIFPLITSYWNQAAGMVKYLGDKSGGMDKLKGKKIVHLYHDSAFGKEPLPVLEAQAKQYGFELIKIAVAPPGSEQQSQWLQIRQANPDHVILWGWGVMNSVAIKTAQRNGFPREKMLGVWWAGSEEDTIGRSSQGLHRDDLQHAGQLSGARSDPQQAVRGRQGQSGGAGPHRFRLPHARRDRRHPVGRGGAHGAGKIRQGQAGDRRADALGPGKPGRQRSAPEDDRRADHVPAGENQLRRS